jgi:hypothetical protein
MRKLLIFLFPALLCTPFLSTHVSATTTAAAGMASNPQLATLYTLQQLETIAYKSATSFYLYNVMNRDPQRLKKMQALLASGDDLVQKLNISSVSNLWQPLKRNLTKANFTSEGVADNTSINAVDASLTALTQELRQKANEERKAQNFVNDKMADMLYDQYVIMQVMTAAYLRKSADYFGGAVVASQGQQVEIDKLAEKFSTQLQQLSQHYQKNPKISDALRVVTTKWGFIRKSFINFNQDNVAFVVGRYNEQITEKLLDAYETLL